MTLYKLSGGPSDSISSWCEIGSWQISTGKLHALSLQRGGHLFVAGALALLVAAPFCPCVVLPGGVPQLCPTCVFSLAVCPQGCLQCSHRDRCHLCDHGFFLKSGLCMATCVPGFSGHPSNESCAGKFISAGCLVMLAVISLCKWWVSRCGWHLFCETQHSCGVETPGAP